MAALVVKEKMRPAPPVARITALARRASTVPVRASIAVTPRHRPSSTRREVTKDSSWRTTWVYRKEVWKRACSMWKPVLSAAKQVRHVVMPPKGRTLMLPSGSRLQGQPQRSSWLISSGACCTKYSTTSWSAR